MAQCRTSTTSDNVERICYDLNKLDEEIDSILVKEIKLTNLSTQTYLPDSIYSKDVDSKSTASIFAIFDGYGFVCEDRHTLNGYSYGKYPTKFEWAGSRILPPFNENATQEI